MHGARVVAAFAAGLLGVLPARAQVSEHPIYSFTGGSDGSMPSAIVVDTKAGVIYGTTLHGGSGNGVVFELTPPGAAGTSWTEQVLHSFNGSDGGWPTAIVEDPTSGTLYGIANPPNGGGSVFALKPPADPAGNWVFSTLHTFG